MSVDADIAAAARACAEMGVSRPSLRAIFDLSHAQLHEVLGEMPAPPPRAPLCLDPAAPVPIAEVVAWLRAQGYDVCRTAPGFWRVDAHVCGADELLAKANARRIAHGEPRFRLAQEA